MSTLRVATIETEDGLTNLSLKTGNTSGPSITIYAGNGEVAFDSVSNMSFTATAIDYSGVVTYSSNATFSGNATFSSATINGNVAYTGTATYTGNADYTSANAQYSNVSYSGTATYTGNADFSSANVTGIEAGISTGKAIAMAIVFG